MRNVNKYPPVKTGGYLLRHAAKGTLVLAAASTQNAAKIREYVGDPRADKDGKKYDSSARFVVVHNND